MATVDWSIKGPSLNTCNCDWGCPCQFNAPPTHGNCRAVFAMQVDDGHFGDVDLAGARFCGMFAWPEAIHLGNGESYAILDERTTDAQRNALFTILKGDETEPGATIFNVFASTFTKVHTPEFHPIDFAFDLESRTARVSVPGIVEASAEPIRNPVTGATHYAKVSLKKGFEYLEAEYCSGTAKATGPVAQDWTGAHGHIYVMHMTPRGPVS